MYTLLAPFDLDYYATFFHMSTFFTAQFNFPSFEQERRNLITITGLFLANIILLVAFNLNKTIGIKLVLDK